MIWVLLAGVVAVGGLAGAIWRLWRVFASGPDPKGMIEAIGVARTVVIARFGAALGLGALIVFLVASGLGIAFGVATAAFCIVGVAMAVAIRFLFVLCCLSASARIAAAVESPERAVISSIGQAISLAIAALAVLGPAFVLALGRDPHALVDFALGAALVVVGWPGGQRYELPEDHARSGDREQRGSNAGDPVLQAGSRLADHAAVAGALAVDRFAAIVAAIAAATALAGSPGQVISPTARLLFPLAIAVAGVLATIVGMLADSRRAGASVGLEADGLVWRSAVLAGASIGVFGLAATSVAGLGFGVLGATIAGLLGAFALTQPVFSRAGRLKLPRSLVADPSRRSAAPVGHWRQGNPLSAVPGEAVVVAAVTLVATAGADLPGVGIATLGMLALAGVMLVSDVCRPIAAGARTLITIDRRVRTEPIDALIAAYARPAQAGRRFANRTAVLTGLALVLAYVNLANLEIISLADVRVLVALVLGGSLPFLFLSATTAREGVRKTSGGTDDPLGARPGMLVDGMMTRSGLLPLALVGLLAPLVIGFGLGKEALAGLLLGAEIVGFLLASELTDGWWNWDNGDASRRPDAGEAMTSVPDAAAWIVAEDPARDLIGSSLHAAIRLMGVLALVLASFFARL